mmetsp:Transcript_18971/g.41915  ORF Transcript_18971/g.41915 Transcript_18971/m.41915 type:complete len:269 (+) Transcript_18971:865-1671(+)
MHHPFRLSSGARCVQHEQRVLSFAPNRFTCGGLAVDHFRPANISCWTPFVRTQNLVIQTHYADCGFHCKALTLCELNSCISNSLQRYRSGPAHHAVGSNQNSRLGIYDTTSQRLRGETPKNDRVHSSKASTSQHRDWEVYDHRQIDRNPVTLSHTILAQSICALTDHVQNLPVRVRSARRIFHVVTLVVERNSVTFPLVHMVIQTIVRHIRGPATKPLGTDRTPVRVEIVVRSDTLEWCFPVQLLSDPPEESLRICDALVVHCFVLFE